MITLHRQKSWPLVKVRQERTEPGLRLAFHSSINMIDAIVDLKNPFTNLVVTETTTDGKQDGKQLVPAGKTHRISKPAKEQRAMAQLLYWSGGALLGLFSSLTILSSVPIALLKPEWQQTFSDSLQGFGVNALIGTVLIVLAGSVDYDHINSPLRTKIQTIRKLAWWAALAWLFLIPFQAYAGMKLVRQTTEQEMQQIRQLQTYRSMLQKATSEAEFRSMMAQIPGAPPIAETIDEPYQTLRDRIVDQFEPQIKKASNILNESRANRIQAWIKEQIKDAVHTFFLAFGFAAIGQTSPGKPTILESLRAKITEKNKNRKSSRKK